MLVKSQTYHVIVKLFPQPHPAPPAPPPPEVAPTPIATPFVVIFDGQSSSVVLCALNCRCG